jgi:hypothetical protein
MLPLLLSKLSLELDPKSWPTATMGAKSIVATFFNCRDRTGSNFFYIKDRREI